MKHLFLTAFIAVFGIYALGLCGILEMTPPDKAPQQVAATGLSFTERVVANNHNAKPNLTHMDGYVLKAMR